MQTTTYDWKIKQDEGKPRMTLVPLQIIYDIADVRTWSTVKYSDTTSWRRIEIERIRDATFRHFLKYLKDPKGLDEESGLPHLAHLATNIAFLCEMEKQNNERMNNDNAKNEN